jgi:capsule polysaccharide export protein KpsC/LpsZ
VDIWEAVARAEAVYTAGGEAGFLALVAGARIRWFSDSFYSGWGHYDGRARRIAKTAPPDG